MIKVVIPDGVKKADGQAEENRGNSDNNEGPSFLILNISPAARVDLIQKGSSNNDKSEQYQQIFCHRSNNKPLL